MGVRRCKIETPRTPSCSASPVELELVRSPKGFTPRRKGAKDNSRREALVQHSDGACGANFRWSSFAPWRLGVKIHCTSPVPGLDGEHEQLGVLGVSTLLRRAS